MVIACVLALGGCFTESDADDDDDDPSDTTGNTTDPTLTTTSDPSFTTSMTTAMTASSDPTTQTDPSVDSSGTSDSDSDTDPTTTTTDPTGGGCPGQGPAVCDDGMVVAGELCFLAPESIDGGVEQIGALAIADINDDGMPDIAFSDGADGYVAFAADGGLQTAGTVVGMVATWSVDIGPLDTQMAVAFGGANAEVYIARWNEGAFGLDAPLGAPGEFVTVRFGDFDDDNQLDLLVGAEGSATLFLYTNDGNGVFGVELDTIDLGQMSGVADLRVLHHSGFANPGIAALTRDGRLLWIPPNDDVLGPVLELDPSQTYGDPTTGRLAAGDLDADGDTDLAVGYDGRAFVFRATALPGYHDPQPLGTSVIGTVTPTIADIDNDGLPDVVIADVPGSAIEIYIADGDGFAHSNDPIQVPPGPRGVGVADFNLDCAADVVALGPAWFQVAEANP